MVAFEHGRVHIHRDFWIMPDLLRRPFGAVLANWTATVPLRTPEKISMFLQRTGVTMFSFHSSGQGIRQSSLPASIRGR